MKSTEYSEKVLDHFKNPRNVGKLAGSNVAMGRVGNPVCGDIMEIYIKVEDDVIEDIRFQTFGCGSAIATSSMTTLMVKGMALDKALQVTRKDVAGNLDGLPPIKMHCSNLAADALHEAIKNFREGKLVDETIEAEDDAIQSGSIKGEMDYLDKGVSYNIADPSVFKDQRVLVLYNGEQSIHAAMTLTKYTGRVILLAQPKKIPGDADLIKQLKRSDVKLLKDSRLLAIMGEGEVEKVKVMDLDEEDEYELFVDAVVLLNTLSMPPACEDIDVDINPEV